MKVTPQITADFEEYPELAVVIDAAIRRVVELMEIHDIGEIRRVRKTGVFDRPYTKDIVKQIGVPNVPSTVSSVRYAVGKALLDYLEAVGVSGLTLSVAKEDVENVMELWKPRQKNAKPQPPNRKKPEAKAASESGGANPKPIDAQPTPPAPESLQEPVTKTETGTGAENPQPKPNKNAKESENGQA